MKVLAILGSPHKGNTLELTQRIEEKLLANGDIEFDYVHLKDADIKPCRGCFMCFIKGEEVCTLKDDIPEIRQKMREADGVIFVSPVYSMTISYLMKLFIDRMAYTFHRPEFFRKYALLVAAAGGPGLDDTLKYMDMFAGSWGFEVVDKLGYFAPPKNTDIKAMMNREDRTDEASLKFYRAMREKKPRVLSKNDHIHFQTMRTIYKKLEKMSPADYQYFADNDWFNKEKKYFYDDVKTNFFHDKFARIISGLMLKQIEK